MAITTGAEEGGTTIRGCLLALPPGTTIIPTSGRHSPEEAAAAVRREVTATLLIISPCIILVAVGVEGVLVAAGAT